MRKEIVVNSDNGEMRAAILEDGALVDLFIERSVHPRYAGNIYKGKVENVLPGMQAAFVDVGLERNVFLYVDDALAGRNGKEHRVVREADGEEIPVPKKSKSIKDILKPGQEIVVQVTKEPIGTKGARVVTDITLPGRYVVLMPTVDYVGISRRIERDEERDRLKKIAQQAKPKRMGVIVRTVAEGRDDKEIAADIQFLTKLWRKIQAKARRAKAPCLLHKDYDLVYRLVRDQFTEEVDKFIVDDPKELKKITDLLSMVSENMRGRVSLHAGPEPIFDSYGLEEEIARALRRKVWLGCGGYIVIDHTEALTVIDVNTGKFIGTTCLADTVLKTNLEAAQEIARQVRLRNIGGIIVVDFIDMDDENHQKMVIKQLEEALARDKTKASVLGFTHLGLVEMTRKKVQQGLVESLMKTCPTCEGRGRILSEETLAFRAMRAIKKEAQATDQPAMLVLIHPSVAAVLIGSGGSNLAALEEQTGKALYVKGSFDQCVEDIVVAAVGTREDVEKKALPVSVGDVIEVTIEEPHMANAKNGIARIEGYVIDVEGAGRLMGTKVRAEVTRVFKTYAKAKVVREEPEEPASGTSDLIEKGV
ncbi:MAG: Rne/Rng family ribonuclease [Firmicutes bacterium]|jgi:ribonuclease G|nr:Rne/Rng family ribonuclease [Bacillota bacterium]